MGEAVAELRQAIALNPELTQARMILARIYLIWPEQSRARDELQVALERVPNHPQLLTLLAEAERQLGNPKRAVELSPKVLAADPKSHQARYYLGLALLDLRSLPPRSRSWSAWPAPAPIRRKSTSPSASPYPRVQPVRRRDRGAAGADPGGPWPPRGTH